MLHTPSHLKPKQPQLVFKPRQPTTPSFIRDFDPMFFLHRHWMAKTLVSETNLGRPRGEEGGSRQFVSPYQVYHGNWITNMSQSTASHRSISQLLYGKNNIAGLLTSALTRLVPSATPILHPNPQFSGPTHRPLYSQAENRDSRFAIQPKVQSSQNTHPKPRRDSLFIPSKGLLFRTR